MNGIEEVPTLWRDNASRTPKTSLISRVWSRLKKSWNGDKSVGASQTDSFIGRREASAIRVPATLTDGSQKSGYLGARAFDTAMTGNVRNVIDETRTGVEDRQRPIEGRQEHDGRFSFSFRQDGNTEWKTYTMEPFHPSVEVTRKTLLTLKSAAAQKSSVTFERRDGEIVVSSDVIPAGIAPWAERLPRSDHGESMTSADVARISSSAGSDFLDQTAEPPLGLTVRGKSSQLGDLSRRDAAVIKEKTDKPPQNGHRASIARLSLGAVGGLQPPASDAAAREEPSFQPRSRTPDPEILPQVTQSSGANLSEASIGKSMIADPESGEPAGSTAPPRESATDSEALGDSGRKSADVIAGKTTAQFQLMSSSAALRDDRSNLDDQDLYPVVVPDEPRRTEISEINVTPLEAVMETISKGIELKTERGPKRLKESVLSGVPEEEPVLEEPAQTPYREDGSGERSSEIAVGKSVERLLEAQEGDSADNKREEKRRSARRQAKMAVRDAQEGGDEMCEELCRLFEEKKKLPVGTIHSITVIGLDDSGLSAPPPVKIARDDRVFSNVELFNVACGNHSFLNAEYKINENNPRDDEILFLTSRNHCKLAMNARQDATNPLFQLALARLYASDLSMRQEYLLTATRPRPVLEMEADTREPEIRELVKRIISSRLPIKLKSVPERDEEKTKFIKGNEAAADSPADVLFALVDPEPTARRPEGGWPFDIMMTAVESSNVLLMPVIINRRDHERDEIVPIGEHAVYPLEGEKHSSLLREYFPKRKSWDQAQVLSPPESSAQPRPLEKHSASTQMQILAGARLNAPQGNESPTIKKRSSGRDSESAAGKSL